MARMFFPSQNGTNNPGIMDSMNETNRNRRDQTEMTENEKKDQIKIERKRSILVVFLEIYGIFEIDISKFLKFV